MGTNGGSGMGAHEVGGMMGSNHPPATEYTLQGVMRFLQTEWHRHERDRNAWEIERQEMKSRIAGLEGQARRADATQNTLKKYVSILEKKVKQQLAQSKEGVDPSQPKPLDRAALLKEKLAPSGDPTVPSTLAADLADEENQRNELRTFLDQCQAEFTYLMVTPANPMPPRDSPPLPVMEDLRETDAFGQQVMDPVYQQQGLSQQQQQAHVRELLAHQARNAAPLAHRGQGAPGPSNYPVKQFDLQSAPMMRTSNAEQSSAMYGNAGEWTGQIPIHAKPPAESGQEPALQPKHPNRAEDRGEPSEKRGGLESDSWDFNDSNFPDPTAPNPPPPPPPQQQQQQQQPHQASPNRPDTDVFPAAENIPKSPNRGALSHRRKSSSSMGRRRSADHELSLNSMSQKTENTNFKLKFGLRGHLDTVRTVIFSGGGSPGEPEICTAGDDGTIKRFHIPDRHPGHPGAGVGDLDVTADFTHRGHSNAVLSLTSWSPSPNFSTGGRAQGDGWIFSGGQDATIRVWERGRVDPKATMDAHADAVWALCVLPANLGSIFGQSTTHGSPDRILLVSGSADGTVKLWAVSAPPQLTSPQPSTGRRGPGGRTRGNSMSSGSSFPNSPQPTTASNSPFHYSLIHSIPRPDGKASPTKITPLSPNGETFVVSYSDAAIIVYDTRTGEPTGTMASLETYDGTIATSVNAVVATVVGLDQPQGLGEEESGGGGPTGGGRAMAGSGVEGVIISGHEDCYVRFFDANSGQCTYNMVAHPASISGLSLSPDGRELVSAGHDGSLRFWSLETRSCTQEITSHRVMRGEGVCSVVWSQDGRWVVSGGGDGVVKVFAR